MKAVALFSGGLDSTLAVKLLEKQGIDVTALNFTSAFFSSEKAEKSAKLNKIRLKTLKLGSGYLKVVKSPRYGHGKAINPCIDCKIHMLKAAKKYAKKIGAKFIAIGFVLNQRPMSQHMSALRTIEKRAGLKGKLLMPLSAQLLPETEAEKKGWVDRNKLMDIQGRGRKRQLALAKKLKIKWFSPVAGGCVLCEVRFSHRFRDLTRHKKRISENDVALLKYGRHFRVENSKIVVGRDKDDNENLRRLKQKTDYHLEVIGVGSPVVILRGKKTKKTVNIAAELTARYSSSPEGDVSVTCGKRKILVKKPISFDEKKYLI
jgi:tRNA U34 2-thiouridine synthase MnmA/TrmU